VKSTLKRGVSFFPFQSYAFRYCSLSAPFLSHLESSDDVK